MSIDNAAVVLAGACAATGWLAYRRLRAVKQRLLRELFARAADDAGYEPSALLVVQPAQAADARMSRLIREEAPRSWYVVLTGPPWLAGLKSDAWERPVGAMRAWSPGKGALREGAYLAIRRGRRFELVHELLPYLERLGSTWPEVGGQSRSAAADGDPNRLLQ